MRSGFQQRRKTLHNALSNGLGMNKEVVQNALINSEIDPKEGQKHYQYKSLLRYRMRYLRIDRNRGY